jgi:hypothetical protein
MIAIRTIKIIDYHNNQEIGLFLHFMGQCAEDITGKTSVVYFN